MPLPTQVQHYHWWRPTSSACSRNVHEVSELVVQFVATHPEAAALFEAVNLQTSAWDLQCLPPHLAVLHFVLTLVLCRVVTGAVPPWTAALPLVTPKQRWRQKQWPWPVARPLRAMSWWSRKLFKVVSCQLSDLVCQVSCHKIMVGVIQFPLTKKKHYELYQHLSSNISGWVW